MSKITESAKGEDCTLRIFPYCDFNPETTVPCHIESEDKATSRKSPDWFMAYGCYTCHGIIDGRIKTDLPESEIYKAKLRGLFLTQKRLREKGLVK